MATCPECKADVPDSASRCPNCGARVIEGDKLESVPKKITLGQKIVIAISIVILIIIGFTYQNAEEREDNAAQNVFEDPAESVIVRTAAEMGMTKRYGEPVFSFDATPKSAEIRLLFPYGPLNRREAAIFGQTIAAQLARAYVEKGYMPRNLLVTISSGGPAGQEVNYGAAVYDGNKDVLRWVTPKARNF